MSEIEQLMLEGWNIHIECKGKGRTYEMTYEATMTKVDGDFLENFYTNHHAVGNTLDELAHNLRKTIQTND